VIKKCQFTRNTFVATKREREAIDGTFDNTTVSIASDLIINPFSEAAV
jgi:hypothetical protein